MDKQLTNKKGLIEKLKKQLSKRLLESDGYEISSNVRWGSTSSNLVCDLVIKKDKLYLAIFEIVLLKESVDLSRRKLTHDVSVSQKRDINLPILIFYCDEDETFKLLFPFSIYRVLKDKPQYKDFNGEIETNAINDVVKAIKEVCKVYTDKPKDKSTSTVRDEKQPKFYESSEKVLDPKWCREQLGIASCKKEKSKATQCKEVCRYSSLDSIFHSIKNKTIRMNGLPGMNDRNEGLFAWNMIYRLENTDNEANKKRRRETNNAFIVSYSSSNLIDDLTQWRLYGDDAKGVCCVYSILQDQLKDRFFLHNVRYIKESNNSDDISDDLLRLFLEYSKEHPLSYYDLSPAIFFYKPDSYKSEDEIRLLVDNKKTTAYKTPVYPREWVLTNANNIPNPYIDIPLDELPLKLERIILGPNMNDVDVIQAQLETMLKQQGFIDTKVELSSIDSYRNPTK